MKYEDKIKRTYRICMILELFHCKDRVVRTVKIGYRSRRQFGGKYKSRKLEELVTAIQRLVLLVPAEEVKDIIKTSG